MPEWTQFNDDIDVRPTTRLGHESIAEARAAVDEALRDTAPPPDYTETGLPITNDAVTDRTSDHRINLADDVPAARLEPVYGGYLDLIMHGDAFGTQAAVNGQRVDFTLDQTAQLIQGSPAWDGKLPIRLMSCSTGQAEYSQDLADTIGVPVYAPDDILAVGGGTKVVLHDGSWRRFEPSAESYDKHRRQQHHRYTDG